MSIQSQSLPESSGAGPETADGGEVKGLIFDIQGHSVHDGPGTRTTVFFGGCPLDCVWCCNPEGLFHHPVVRYMSKRCVRCGNCLSACPRGALSRDGEGTIVLDRNQCDKCRSHECIAACYHEALIVTGRYYTIDELMRIFKRDRQFWASRGGVSLSGGEPLLQRSFILPLLKRCKETYIHVCIETTSCLDTEYFLDVMKYVDWAFLDLKHMDPQRHKELTGVDNTLILKNIRLLAESGWSGFPVPRIPVIPDVDDEANIRATAAFVK